MTAGGSFTVTTAATVTITAGIQIGDCGSGDLLKVNAGSSAVTIAAAIFAPSSAGANSIHVIYTNTGSVTINGNISAVGAATNAEALFYEGTGALAITGNISGGTGWPIDFYGSTNDFTVNGNITGGTASSRPGISVNNTFSSTFTITGNVTGGSASNAYGVNMDANAFTSGGNIVVAGDVTGGTDVQAYGLYVNSFHAAATVRGGIKPGIVSGGATEAIAASSTGKQLRVSGDIYAGGTGGSTAPHGFFPIQGAWTVIGTETLSIHLLDDSGFPSSSGGSELVFAVGGSGGGITRPATGKQWPLP